jgi:hypothetical protein
MSFFKKKIYVEAAMRRLLYVLLSRDLDRALVEIAGGDIFTREDINRLKTEIPAFDVAISLALFINHFGWGSMDSGTVAQKFPTALIFALQDSGLAEESLEARWADLHNRSGTYLVSLKSVGDAELSRAGFFFWYCHEFRERIIPAAAKGEDAEERRLQAFEVAKQNYKLAKQALKTMTDSYKLVIQ